MTVGEWQKLHPELLNKDNYLAITFGKDSTKENPFFYVKLLPKPMEFDPKTEKWVLLPVQYENRYLFDETWSNESIAKEECIAGIKKKYGIDITE
jgi:hypothetical protein